MHYVMAKGILSAGGNINLYRGCTHGCIYCDSRSRCYHIDHAFEDVEVKQNAVELLEDALRRRRAPCMVGTGSMTDPYLPLEAELRLTRRAMEVVERYGCGFTVITKSDLILRDLDLLRRINRELNVTLVIITHSLSVARNICDRVAMIDGGRIVEMGDTEELFSNPQSDILKTLITDAKVENHRHKHDSASSDEQTDAPTKEEVK